MEDEARADAQHDVPGVLDPRLALEVISGTDAAVRSNLRVNSALIYLAWGVAWLAGYLALFVTSGSGRLPAPWAFGLLAALLLAAGVVTGVEGARAARGVAGRSSVIGHLWSLAWAAAFAGGLTLVGSVARHGAPPDVSGSLWALAPVLLVGVLYAGSGAMAADPVMARLGAWLCVVAGAASLAPLHWVYLLVAALGGGGMLAAAAVSRHAVRGARHRVH